MNTINQPPIFRKYAAADIKAVAALMAQLGYKQSENMLAKNIKAIRGNGGEVFVAERSGKVCGCVSVSMDVRLAGGLSGEITSLVVDEAARGSGLGKGLVLIAEEWVQNRAQSVRVRTNVVRERAHAFYKNRGYSLVKKQAVFDKEI